MNWPLTGSGVPILSKQELEYVADQYTQAFSRFDGNDNAGFSVLKFAVNFLRKTVSFEHLSNNSCILGISVFLNDTPIPIYQPATGRVEWKPVHANAILLDKSLEPGQFTSVTKARFTLMHESAHQILHGEFYRKLANRKPESAVAD